MDTLAMLTDNSLEIDDYFDDEQECIKRVRKGDSEAFRVIVLAYYSELCNFAWQFVQSQTEAEDIVQDILANVWELKDNWFPESSIKAYLYRAVKNQSLNYINHQETEEKYLKVFRRDREKVTLPKKFDESERLQRTVRQAIEELPKRAQMVYKLHRRDGFTYKEIAYIMDISPKTVDSQICRSLRMLRKKITPFLSAMNVLLLLNTLIF